MSIGAHQEFTCDCGDSRFYILSYPGEQPDRVGIFMARCFGCSREYRISSTDCEGAIIDA